MSVKISSELWASSNQKGTPLLILIALADWCNDEGYCWPSISKIAKKARLGERGVQKVLKKLQLAGALRVIERGGMKDGEYFANTYQVLTGVSHSSPLPKRRVNKIAKRGEQSDQTGVSHSSPYTSGETSEEPPVVLFPDSEPREVKCSFNEQKKNKGIATLEEVKEFAISKGFPASDGEHMFNSWEASGWMRGKNKIKNWQAAFRTWITGGWLPSQKPASKFQNGTAAPILKHIPTAKEQREQRGLTI